MAEEGVEAEFRPIPNMPSFDKDGDEDIKQLPSVSTSRDDSSVSTGDSTEVEHAASSKNVNKKRVSVIVSVLALLAITMGLGIGLGGSSITTNQATVQAKASPQASLKQCLEEMYALVLSEDLVDQNNAPPDAPLQESTFDASGHREDRKPGYPSPESESESYSGDEYIESWPFNVDWQSNDMSTFLPSPTMEDDGGNDDEDVRRNLAAFILPSGLDYQCLEVLAFMEAQPVCEVDPPMTLRHNMVFDISETDLRDPNFDQTRFEFTEEDFYSASGGANFGADIIAGLLRSQGIPIPSWVFDVLSLGGLGDRFSLVTIEPVFKPAIDIESGGYYEVDSIEKGTSVEVKYPVDVDIEFPSSNSFKCGDQIKVKTTPTLLGGDSSRMSVDTSSYEIELGTFVRKLTFNISFGLKVSACIGIPNPLPFLGFECIGIPQDFDVSSSLELFSIPIGADVPLVNLCQQAFEPDASIVDLLACGSLPDGLQSLTAIIQSLIDVQNEIRGTNYQLIDFEEGKVSIATPDLPSFVGSPIPEISIDFSSTIDNTDLTFESFENGSRLTTSGLKEVASAELDLVDIIATVLGIPTSFSLGGDTISIDLGDFSPDLSVEQEAKHEFEATIYATFDLKRDMEYEVTDENGNFVARSRNSEVKIKAGHDLTLTYPQDLQDATNLISSYSIDGEFKVRSSKKLYRSFNLRLFQVSVGGDDAFTLLNQNVAKKLMDEGDTENHIFPIGSDLIESFLQSPVTLDPERPVLELDLEIIRTLNIGGGNREVTLQIHSSNDGDVPLCDVLLLATLMPQGIFGDCLESLDFVPSPTFEDELSSNLIAPGQGLEIDQGGSIQVKYVSTPARPTILPSGCFDPISTTITAGTQGFGTSPIGTRVEDGLNECTGARRTERNEVTANIGSRGISSIEDFALYGYGGIELSAGMSPSTGDIGSNRDIVISRPLQCETAVGTTPDNPGELRGSVHVEDDFIVEDGAHFVVDYLQIGDDLQIGGKASKSKKSKSLSTSTSPSSSSKSSKAMPASLNVLGASSENSDCVKAFDPPSKSSKITAKSKAGKSAKSIVVSGIEEVLPDEYYEILAEEGATLRLGPGDYTIHRLVVNAGATIVAVPSEQVVSVQIAKWDFQCGSKSGKTSKTKCSKSSKGDDDKNLRRSSTKSAKGIKDCSFSLQVEGGNPSQLMLRYFGGELYFEDATLQGILNAAEAYVSLEGSSLQGNLYANTIFIGAKSRFFGYRELIGAENSLCDDMYDTS